MNARLRILILALTIPALVLLLGMSALGAAASAAPASCGCENLRILDSSGHPLKVTPGKQPVLLVHGMGNPVNTQTDEGTPSQWDDQKADGKSLAKLLGDDDNYVVGRFDYSDSKYKWVTDKTGSPDGKSTADKLAAAIQCMAQQSGKKVIVVGHSMGGLATQAALQDLTTQKNVAGFISVGTPWLGTRWPFHSSTTHKNANGGLLSNPVLNAMSVGSAELKGLAPIPSGIPVLPVAGVVTDPPPAKDPQSGQVMTRSTNAGQRVNLVEAEVNLLGQIRQKIVAASFIPGAATGEGYDPWVGENSALHPPMKETSKLLTSIKIECKRDANPSYCYKGFPDSGFHSALPSDPMFAQAVLPTIQKWRAANAPSSGVGGPGCASASPAVKKLPVTVSCSGDDILVKGKCVSRASQGSTASQARKTNPPQSEQSGDEQQSEPQSQESSEKSSGDPSCGNGMVRVAPETDTSSGCAPAGSQNKSKEEDAPTTPTYVEPQDQVCPPVCGNKKKEDDSDN